MPRTKPLAEVAQTEQAFAISSRVAEFERKLQPAVPDILPRRSKMSAAATIASALTTVVSISSAAAPRAMHETYNKPKESPQMWRKSQQCAEAEHSSTVAMKMPSLQSTSTATQAPHEASIVQSKAPPPKIVPQQNVACKSPPAMIAETQASIERAQLHQQPKPLASSPPHMSFLQRTKALFIIPPLTKSATMTVTVARVDVRTTITTIPHPSRQSSKRSSSHAFTRSMIKMFEERQQGPKEEDSMSASQISVRRRSGSQTSPPPVLRLVPARFRQSTEEHEEKRPIPTQKPTMKLHKTASDEKQFAPPKASPRRTALSKAQRAVSKVLEELKTEPESFRRPLCPLRRTQEQKASVVSEQTRLQKQEAEVHKSTQVRVLWARRTLSQPKEEAKDTEKQVKKIESPSALTISSPKMLTQREKPPLSPTPVTPRTLAKPSAAKETSKMLPLQEKPSALRKVLVSEKQLSQSSNTNASIDIAKLRADLKTPKAIVTQREKVQPVVPKVATMDTKAFAAKRVQKKSSEEKAPEKRSTSIDVAPACGVESKSPKSPKVKKPVSSQPRLLPAVAATNTPVLINGLNKACIKAAARKKALVNDQTAPVHVREESPAPLQKSPSGHWKTPTRNVQQANTDTLTVQTDVVTKEASKRSPAAKPPLNRGTSPAPAKPSPAPEPSDLHKSASTSQANKLVSPTAHLEHPDAQSGANFLRLRGQSVENLASKFGVRKNVKSRHLTVLGIVFLLKLFSKNFQSVQASLLSTNRVCRCREASRTRCTRGAQC